MACQEADAGSRRRRGQAVLPGRQRAGILQIAQNQEGFFVKAYRNEKSVRFLLQFLHNCVTIDTEALETFPFTMKPVSLAKVQIL